MAVIRTKGNTFDFARAVTVGAKGDAGNADGKADLVDGTVPLEQLPVSQAHVGGLIAQYDEDGALAVVTTGSPGYAAETQWVQDKIDELTVNPKVLAKVDSLQYIPADPLTPLALNTDGSTYITIPVVGVYDAASDEVYDCFPWMHYTGPGGIKVRRKANGSAVTNLLGFPSFEGGVVPTGWSWTGGVTVTVDNADSRSGSYSMKAAVTATSSGQQVFSPWCAHEQGIKASMAGYIKRISSTVRTVRIDGQYGDDAGNVLGSFTGINTTPGTDWLTRGIADATHLGGTGSQIAPSGTTKTRLRWTIVSPSSGDIFRLDDAQVERSDNVPAVGSTGGSGGALSCYGLWYPDVQIAQAAGDAPAAASFATTGAKALAGFQTIAVGGTGLTGQHIEYEATVATPGQATSITRAGLSYARVKVPA